MNQIYQMKISFDETNWYQLEWLNIEFRKFDETIKNCNNIEELESKILTSFPKSELKYEFLGKREKKMFKESKKTKKKK
jgi:hypothetical protein